MNQTTNEHYQNLLARYQSGEMPWDDTLPPPEVIDYVATLTPSRALDLGCGPGRTAIFLAQQGWDVDAIDFIPQAIEMAKKRARQAGVSPRFHQASVTDLSFLKGQYDLAVDVGCLHGLPEQDALAYRRELAQALKPGGHFLLFARLRSNENNETPLVNGPSGLDETVLLHQFEKDFTLNNVEYGATQVGDKAAWQSAWFWFTRSSNS